MSSQYYEGLQEREKEQFKVVMNELLTRNYIVEREYNTRHGQMRTNMNYRFIESNIELFEEILEMMGWKLVHDQLNGVFCIKSSTHSNNISLNKYDTWFLFILRIIFEEKHEVVSFEKEIRTTLSDILNKIEILKLTVNNLPAATIRESLIKLRKFNLIEKIDAKYEDPSTRFVIYPSICHVIDYEAIMAILEEFQSVDKQYEILDEGDEPSEDIY